jgi:RND family efflux transporter MFP subunit
MRKFMVGILFIAVGIAMGTYFLSFQNAISTASSTNTTPRVAIDLIVPEKSTMRLGVEVYGTLAPKTLTHVKNEVPGRIETVRIKEWDQVAKGDVLLLMDQGDVKVALSRSQAGLGMAKAQLLQARVDFNRAKREWNRALKLKEGGLITGQELDERKTTVESTEARVALAQAQVHQSESQIAEVQRSMEKTTIRSPISGTISQRNVDIGDWADKGQLLFTIVDNSILDFTASVAATDLPLMHEGQALTFTVDGLPSRSFKGVIKRINPMVSDSDRSGRIVAEVENTEGTLKGGLFARGSIVVEERSNVLTLPRAALMNWDIENGTARVFLVDDEDAAKLREVKTGLNQEDLVEIKEGLSEGERVVLRGGFNLQEGDLVQYSVGEKVQ